MYQTFQWIERQFYPDYQWDQLHFANRALHAFSLNRSRHAQKFRPGDIAACTGSVLSVFYKYLQQLGILLAPWESPLIGTAAKLRYCIIRKHIKGNQYEVFLMTTFGGARNQHELSPIAQYFGMPMGDTQWMRDVPALKTTPPTFGTSTKSFIFAIPTVGNVETANTHVHVRLVPGEMERLSEFVDVNSKRIQHDQARLRTDLQNIFRSKLNWTLEDDAIDTFSPQVIDDIDDTKNDIPPVIRGKKRLYPHDLYRRRRPPRLLLPPANDLSWLMRHLRRDILHSSRYLDSLPPHRPRLTTLPEPFYAPCLRITAKQISRLIL